ncbi:MAG: N-acetyltransferase [Caldilineaceae bacterium]
MLKIIIRDHHSDYFQKFKEAVYALFPILCFTASEAEDFVQTFSGQPDNQNVVFVDQAGRLTFCRYSIESQEASFIHYIIPSSWSDRFTLVKEALQQIQQEFIAANSGHELRMRINEQLPSHTAYYAGLLPEQGFELTPRVTMVAGQTLVDQLTLPELPTWVQEVAYSADRLQETVTVYLQAHRTNHHAFSLEKQAQKSASAERYIAEIYELERTVQTWTGLIVAGRLIGFSCGGLWGDEMSLEEIALVPEFQGQGLGRYLTIRCMQKLYMNFAGPDKYFGLGTERTNTQALKLYQRLGFKIDKIETYAMFEAK